MSILSYVVIAEPSEARKVGENFLSKKFVWFDFPALTPDVLDALHSVLTGEPLTSTKKMLRDHPEKMILPLLYARDPSNGCWVFQIPSSWVKAIAKIEEEDVPSIMKKWVKTSWNLKSWDAHGGLAKEHIAKNLICFRDLCKKAIRKKTSLLLFVSL